MEDPDNLRYKINYDGGVIPLPGHGRAIKIGERVHIHSGPLMGNVGTVRDTMEGLHIFEYYVEIDKDPGGNYEVKPYDLEPIE